MKKNIKIIVLFTIILAMITTTVIGATITTNSITSTKDLGDAGTKIESVGSRVLTTISNVGIVLSVVMLAIIGVKYMMGSADERAEYKKTLLPYIIGAFLIFGASTVAKIVKTVGEKL